VTWNFIYFYFYFTFTLLFFNSKSGEFEPFFNEKTFFVYRSKSNFSNQNLPVKKKSIRWTVGA